MIKKDFIELLSDRLNISHFNAEHIIDRILKNMIYALRKNEKISISGFGVFENKDYKCKNVLNPRTKEQMLVPAYKKTRFSPSVILLKQLNEKAGLKNG